MRSRLTSHCDHDTIGTTASDHVTLPSRSRACRLVCSSAERTDFVGVHADAILDPGEVLTVLPGRSHAARSLVAAALELYERNGHVAGIGRARAALAQVDPQR